MNILTPYKHTYTLQTHTHINTCRSRSSAAGDGPRKCEVSRAGTISVYDEVHVDRRTAVVGVRLSGDKIF